MKTVAQMVKMLVHDGDGFTRHAAEMRMVRLAAMVGWDGFTAQRCTEYDEAEVPNDIVSRILTLDYSERATGDLRAMGESIGRLKVSVPSNINVWSHAKGELPLARAAESLAAAAKSISERLTA